MLSAPDGELVLRDPRIPGLARILDSDAFTETLRELCPDAGVTAAEPCYVRYKAGTSCLVGYRVSIGPDSRGAGATGAAGVAAVGVSDTVGVFAKAHNPEVDGKVRRADQEMSVRSPLGAGITVIPDASIVVYPFPNDRRLPALRDLSDAGPRRSMLEELLPDRSDLWDRAPTALRYKPERRFVARASSDTDPGCVLRFYTKDDYRAINRNPQRFESAGPLRLARPVQQSKRYHAVSVEWIDGTLLRDELLTGADSTAHARTVGAAIARLHVQKVKIREFQTAESYASSVRNAATAVAELNPGIADRVERIAERIAGRLEQRHFRSRRSIHGDLSAEQIIIQDDTASIIDLDRAGRGDPRVDLGNFRARLEYDVIRGLVTADVAASFMETLLDSYRAESDKDVTRKLDRFTASCLLHLAVEPFRYRSPDWASEMEALVARADALSESGKAVDA